MNFFHRKLIIIYFLVRLLLKITDGKIFTTVCVWKEILKKYNLSYLLISFLFGPLVFVSSEKKLLNNDLF